jgi:hypothetical protein
MQAQSGVGRGSGSSGKSKQGVMHVQSIETSAEQLPSRDLAFAMVLRQIKGGLEPEPIRGAGSWLIRGPRLGDASAQNTRSSFDEAVPGGAAPVLREPRPTRILELLELL